MPAYRFPISALAWVCLVFFAAGYAYGRIPYQLHDRHYPVWAVMVQWVGIVLLCASAIRTLRRQVLDQKIGD